MILALLAGLGAGTVHVITGPDHLAAVAPIALRQPLRAARAGAAWGLGHGLGVAVLGGLGIAARGLVDVHGLSGWSEFLVGFLLVGLGLSSLRSALGMKVHDHEHRHADEVHGVQAHGHPHLHFGGAHDDAAHRAHTHAAFGVGILHGAAGMGHLLGVIPSLALPPLHAAAYLSAYLLAAVLSMAAFGLLLGQLGQRAGPGRLRGALVLASLFTIGTGGFWLLTTWPG